MTRLNIAFFGSSLVSAYWNGAATYYRGLIHALSRRGHRVTFYEPDAYDRQEHRDIADPPWAKVVIYPANVNAMEQCLEDASGADLIIKTSGVGVLDHELEAGVLQLKRATNLVCFWDSDAPATLDRMNADPADALRRLVPHYDLILTYGGGEAVVQAYAALKAKACIRVHNALDPATHHPVEADPRLESDLAFLGNRLPDLEKRVEDFFFRAAALLPDQQFILAGSGWMDAPTPQNVRTIGLLYARDHNAFHCTPLALLHLSREDTARYGASPAARVFEAAGAGACMISDALGGIGMFLEPGREVLVARSGEEIAEHLQLLTPQRARQIGQAAMRRVLSEHTYDHRVALLEGVLEGNMPAMLPPGMTQPGGAIQA